ncbi:hypothetical protein L7F22_061574 [Adiantum nelumboides]|nr:hypothetical protein [Adiantum nelumboides]
MRCAFGLSGLQSREEQFGTKEAISKHGLLDLVRGTERAREGTGDHNGTEERHVMGRDSYGHNVFHYRQGMEEDSEGVGVEATQEGELVAPARLQRCMRFCARF